MNSRRDSEIGDDEERVTSGESRLVTNREKTSDVAVADIKTELDDIKKESTIRFTPYPITGDITVKDAHLRVGDLVPKFLEQALPYLYQGVRELCYYAGADDLDWEDADFAEDLLKELNVGKQYGHGTSFDDLGADSFHEIDFRDISGEESVDLYREYLALQAVQDALAEEDSKTASNIESHNGVHPYSDHFTSPWSVGGYRDYNLFDFCTGPIRTLQVATVSNWESPRVVLRLSDVLTKDPDTRERSLEYIEAIASVCPTAIVCNPEIEAFLWRNHKEWCRHVTSRSTTANLRHGYEFLEPTLPFQSVNGTGNVTSDSISRQNEQQGKNPLPSTQPTDESEHVTSDSTPRHLGHHRKLAIYYDLHQLSKGRWAILHVIPEHESTTLREIGEHLQKDDALNSYSSGTLRRYTNDLANADFIDVDRSSRTNQIQLTERGKLANELLETTGQEARLYHPDITLTNFTHKSIASTVKTNAHEQNLSLAKENQYYVWNSSDD